LFKSKYDDFLKEIAIYELATVSDPGNVEIDIEYNPIMFENDEFAEFAIYVVDECSKKHSTANSYKSSIRKITEELKITDILDLEKRIDEAIDFCTKGIENAKKFGDEKKKKTYNDCRSALRKYKEFMESKKTANS
jgi:site-specific recombinase XerD